jgi:hypothetical protein
MAAFSLITITEDEAMSEERELIRLMASALKQCIDQFDDGACAMMLPSDRDALNAASHALKKAEAAQ